MKTLSKSRLIAYRQCPKRLWLEVHQPELRAVSSATQAAFASGHSVGAIARVIYDPEGAGTELDLGALGLSSLLEKTRELLPQGRPIFEAGFASVTGGRALALADVLLPDNPGKATSWRMIEVKSTTSVKDYHRDDAAIQHFIATNAGVTLSGVALARIDSTWTYPGENDYRGFLVEEDMTADALARSEEVKGWIRDAHKVVALPKPPEIDPGDHCTKPFECGFSAHCNAEYESENGVVTHPVYWLPRIQANALKRYIATEQVRSLLDVPDELLNATQRRVKQQTLHDKVFFDAEGAASALAPFNLPALFLDFETIAYAVPKWAGTRPYQQIPFQFSVHRLLRTGRTEHTGFLDLSGRDPSAAFAEALVEVCEGSLPIFVYNKGFEGARIRELAVRFPCLAVRLGALDVRLVDLYPIAQAHYYHPSQQGSWSIKAVLPAIAPELRYDNLEGVKDGGGAQAAFFEAVDPETQAVRKTELKKQLWRYCRLDTFAMIRLWGHFSGRNDLTGKADDAKSVGSPI